MRLKIKKSEKGIYFFDLQSILNEFYEEKMFLHLQKNYSTLTLIRKYIFFWGGRGVFVPTNEYLLRLSDKTRAVTFTMLDILFSSVLPSNGWRFNETLKQIVIIPQEFYKISF